MRHFFLLSAATLALALPAAAQAAPDDTPAASPTPTASDEDQSQDHSSEIVVTGVLQQSEKDVLSGTSLVSGEALTRDLRPSIGETLARQPGVSATSFGPSASRPILRGFQGERVRVLTDGIGAIDVSSTSADHAVIIDPLLAERVEVLRGPAVLLFGSSAIGGVVNVIDTRIPRRVPENGYRLDAIATYGSASNERSFGAAGDAAIGGNFVAHVDGSYLKTEDLRIGGYALTPAARAQAAAAAAGPTLPDDPDFAATAALKGTLPNTAAETWTAGVGLAYASDNANIGVSYSHYDSLYGVPIRYALASGEEQEAPRLDVLQNRFDIRADVSTGGGLLDKVRFRGGYANYRHFELEDTGAIGTAFYNKGYEGRLEFVQANRGGWQGASGVQYFHRDFDVVGSEAFLPRSTSSQVGIFTLQQVDLGKLRAEGGLRYERSTLTSRPDAGDLRFPATSRSFDAISGSAGLSLELAEGVRIGANVSRTERAPSADELFANGGHAGTQAWELGNPDFGLEQSWGLETTLHVHKDGFSFDGSAYYDWFSGYISEDQVAQSVCQAAAAPSGRTVDLPCFRFSQTDARYYGVEGDMSVRLATIGSATLNFDLLGDYVHASANGNNPVPRIPPARLLGGFELQSDTVTGRIEAEHVFEQNRIAPFETPTADYTLVNASVAIRPFANNRKLSLTLSANNIFDVDARRHSSFLKDFAPLAGRDLRATVRLGF
ncbi:TonB-dependent receptor [Sphingomonas sp. LB-2]|uniref:TonB-dependent receptor n=1 Tax=Sphingomonas caeni TaxID=2984949 RepID=UPI00222F794C|nr:TonB-dependent receptor [Sphingomonas caeni]MCW3847664.1 TonB-dependent receptor [Sphingomonas caeni]